MAPRVWPVFFVYVLAFVAIVAFTIVAAVGLRVLYPDLAESELFNGLPGLLAGGVASSLALSVTVLSVSRPLDLGRLRLRPGRETGRDLVAIVLGTLALGQALDSLTLLAGLGQRGSMAVIRRALEGAAGRSRPEACGASGGGGTLRAASKRRSHGTGRQGRDRRQRRHQVR